MKYLIAVCEWNSGLCFGESTYVLQGSQFCSPRTTGYDSVATAIILSLIFKRVQLVSLLVQFPFHAVKGEGSWGYPKILGRVEQSGEQKCVIEGKMLSEIMGGES